MRVLSRVELALLEQRGALFPWAPVCLALGIGGYFAMPVEPTRMVYLALGSWIFVGALAAWRWHNAWSPLIIALVLIAIGFCLAGWRAHQVSAPVLQFRYYGPIEGRIVGMNRSASDALRLTLDQVYLADTSPERVPDRVRISLHGEERPELKPGQRIMTTGHLSPPQGPVEPGGFDFRRHAWFQGLGGVGYTRMPVLTASPASDGAQGLRVLSFRMAASERVREILPGDVGGFAAAVTTGDRSGVGQAALEALRASNTAHLLAISGLHMGLLTGFVFGVLRLALAALPGVALRWPIKKLAAFGALLAGMVYLALSGGNVATERAFVMAAVVLLAVMLDRRAFSLRAVAMAALIVLTLRPEALLGPGFQMSFAATTALVAVFGAMRDARIRLKPKWFAPVLGVVISSAVAGAATAPVGAAHFNVISHYGLIANLLSVPLMGVLVVPAAVAAALLAPFGWEFLGLVPMGWGLAWILWVAEWVSGLDGARRFVVSPAPVVLPMIALGALIVILWQGRARWIGILPVLVALGLWTGSERPVALIADSGGLVGVMTEEGRALSKARGAGFVARAWLENDGDGAEQAYAAARWEGAAGPVRSATAAGVTIVHVIGKRAAAQISDCMPDELVIASVTLELTGGCRVYDPAALRSTGSLALTRDGTLISARSVSGKRIWNTRMPGGRKRQARSDQ